jgi:hypothetical protein
VFENIAACRVRIANLHMPCRASCLLNNSDVSVGAENERDGTGGKVRN